MKKIEFNNFLLAIIVPKVLCNRCLRLGNFPNMRKI